MSRYVEVSTQAQLDKLGPNEIAVVRSGFFVARESAHVVAWGSAHVVAWESAHVVAWGSAHVEAWESAHVVARGSAHVVARGSAHVEASKFVATHRLSRSADVTGGVIIDVQIDTPRDWCDLYGIPVADGKAVLYKAVEDDWKGAHKKPRLIYKPGRTVTAPDWEPHAGCGNGLHLSPHPRLAQGYCPDAVHYLAVEVDVDSLALIDDKVKTQTCRVLHEVDLDGDPIGGES